MMENWKLPDGKDWDALAALALETKLDYDDFVDRISQQHGTWVDHMTLGT